jgi:alkylation response protein AidB-like acyl-CoA dehydrogenase
MLNAANTNTEFAQQQLRGIVTGDVITAIALYEQGQRYELTHLQTTLDGGALSGTKHYVLDGGSANTLIVAATDSASPALAMVLVDPQSAGVSVAAYESVDGTPLATVRFDSVAVSDSQIIAQGSDAQQMLDNALAMAVYAISADILGACDAALSQTVAYLKVREQFGRALHTFQALQHRASDQHAEIEMLRSLVLGAGQTLSEGMNASSRADALAAGVMAAEVGDHVGREAIQMHGAIGMTADLGVGKYLMRANTLTRLFGDSDNYRDRFIDCIEETAA